MTDSYYYNNEDFGGTIEASEFTDGEFRIEFCVDGPAVIEFFLNATIDDQALNVIGRFRLNGTSVARANVGANNVPTVLSLFYLGEITGETFVEVIIEDGDLQGNANWLIRNKEL